MNNQVMLTAGLVVALVAGSCGQASTGHSGATPPTSSADPSATAEPSVLAPSPTSGAGAHETDQVARLTVRGSDFYVVPDPHPAGDRGTLIRLQPMPDNELGRVYRVLYHSTSVDGSAVAVSGMIWVPAEPPPAGGYPIVAWGPGNNGSGDPCPYSVPSTPEAVDYSPLMFNLLRAKYVVAYTDYEGHGTRYPYLFALPESVTHSLLDGARAARDLLGGDASDRVVIAGHSLGGFAAGESLQFGSAYAGELDVRGALAMEGGGDVESIEAMKAAAIAGTNPPIQGIVAWAAAYPELGIADLLTPQAVSDSRAIETTCEAAGAFFDHRSARDLFATKIRNVAAWDKRIEASVVRKAPFPAFFVAAGTSATGGQDIRAIAQRLCRVSHDIRFEIYPGADHDGVLQAALPDYIAWMADRFAGVPAAGNCGD
jgi:Secretory lipase